MIEKRTNETDRLHEQNEPIQVGSQENISLPNVTQFLLKYHIMKNMIRYVPNMLSLIRLVLAFLLPLSPERYWFWIILGGGGTDFLDGWVARRWMVQSWQGGLLDAAADKIFIISALFTFVATGNFSVWWIPGIIIRDVTVIFIAVYAVYYNAWKSFKNMDARLSGKMATGGQFLLLVLVSLGFENIRYILLLAIFLSFVAAVDYGKQFAAALHYRTIERTTSSR